MQDDKRQILVQQLLSGLLFLAVIGLLGWLSTQFKIEADWTAGNRNTISEASQRQLDAMDGPLTFTAFISPSADVRKAVEGQIAKYQRFKDDISVEFIDPSTQPQKVREMEIAAAGEVVIEYEGRRENLQALSEQSITTALQRLAYAGEQWVVFVEGHGERRIEGESTDSIGQFAQALRDKGIKPRSLNLVKTPTIPDNTSVLVLASPQKALLEGEQALIAEYVENGGNLLWMADPDWPAGIAPLADQLGIDWQQGYAVFPDYEVMGTGHPGFFLSTEYPATAVTRELFNITIFPLVQAINWQADSGWVVKPFLKTPENAWLETGPIEGRLSFSEAEGDVPGPLDIGVLLTRSVSVGDEAPEAADDNGDAQGDAEPEQRPQRVALVGDADFLSNAYLAEMGNQQLALNLIQWLASRDEQINIDIPEAPDSSLFLPPWALMLIAGTFVVGIPVLLLGLGIGRWVVRRRR